ncbi:MAG: trypsin-like serine protease [Minicystis sp.]
MIRARRSSLSVSLLGLALAAGSVLLGGCVEPTQRGAAVPAAHPAEDLERPLQLMPPFAAARTDDAVVRITGDVSCTGTLIADDRVLTAHHCVSARDREGRALDHDKRPDQLTIELGGDYLPWGEVKVRAVIAPDCGYTSGDGDIAILVLSRHLIGIPTAMPRLEGAPVAGKEIEVLGFGRCALSPNGIMRVSRTAEPVTLVDAGHVEARASICPGDSGGPMRDRHTKEILGVVSASVMDGDDTTMGRSLFTRVDIWPEIFWAAEEVSNGTSLSELPPYGTCRGRGRAGHRSP